MKSAAGRSRGELPRPQAEAATVLALERRPDFVETPAIRGLAERALDYLRAGYPVHFSGPAGTGKTALAMHVAALLGRPVILLHGNDEFGSSDLIGAETGYRSTQVVDNYVRSVIKREENVSPQWRDHRLTTACRHGFTLIYDEFTRSRPEANNVLLAILEERLLSLPGSGADESYLQVHPQFRAIFTSNPEEYAGVHKTQDALADRMITLRVGHHDLETEVAITQAKSGLSRRQAASVVAIVRECRAAATQARPSSQARPSIRACIVIGRLAAARRCAVSAGDPVFRQLCCDVLDIGGEPGLAGTRTGLDTLDEIIERCCPPAAGMAAALPPPGAAGRGLAAVPAPGGEDHGG